VIKLKTKNLFGQTSLKVPPIIFGTSCLGNLYQALEYDYFAVPWQKVLFSDHLDEKQLVLVEPLTVGFHAIARADVTNNDTSNLFITIFAAY